MANKIQVFDPAGGISFQSIPVKESAFITITPVRSNKYYNDSSSTNIFRMGDSNVTGRGNKGSALYAHMPITGVHIAQGVDMSISKTLNADFLVAEFGDNPVQITLAGVNFYGDITCNGIGNVQHKQIMDFYERNKLSADIKNRIDISVTPASSPNSGAFRCVLVRMRSSTPIKDGQGTVPAYTYELSLIGVRR